MRRMIHLALVATVVFTTAHSASAENPFKTIWHSFKRDWHRNNIWPEPFPHADRAAVHAPFDTMVINGWRRQNLLAKHHFTEDGMYLTRAGELKARWIMTQVPPRHRTIFIERGVNEQVTQTRIDAAQQYAAHFMPHGNLPDVQESHIVEEGRPAAAIDTVYTRYMQSMPPPVLPASNGDMDE